MGCAKYHFLKFRLYLNVDANASANVEILILSFYKISTLLHGSPPPHVHFCSLFMGHPPPKWKRNN